MTSHVPGNGFRAKFKIPDSFRDALRQANNPSLILLRSTVHSTTIKQFTSFFFVLVVFASQSKAASFYFPILVRPSIGVQRKKNICDEESIGDDGATHAVISKRRFSKNITARRCFSIHADYFQLCPSAGPSSHDSRAAAADGWNFNKSNAASSSTTTVVLPGSFLQLVRSTD